MKRRIHVLLYGVFGCYFLVRSYLGFLQPAPVLSRLMPYLDVLLGGFCFYAAIKAYKDAEPGSIAEPLSRTEKIIFKLVGVPTIFAGLVLIGLGCWLAWDQWSSGSSVVIHRAAQISYSRELFKGPASSIVIGGLLLAGGVFVYRGAALRHP